MCLLYFLLNSDPSSEGYRLILCNVRDEYVDRPTKECCWWEDNPDVIGGIDIQPGREGGTWLAMNKSTRKIGVLLNVLTPSRLMKPDTKSRGSLVTNFVKGRKNGVEYLNELSKESCSYENFSMVTIELGVERNEDCVGYYTNCDQKKPQVLPTGLYGFGNNGPYKEWRKIGYGRGKFSEIVEKYPNVKDESKLADEIFQFLHDDTEHYPDDQIDKQGVDKPAEARHKLSAIHVCIPMARYASRTKSIILIDANGNGKFIEKTMSNSDCSCMEWKISKFEFNVKI